MPSKSAEKLVCLSLCLCILLSARAAFASTKKNLCVIPELTAPKKYVCGIDRDNPPYSFIGDDGKPAGFDVESLRWIAGEMRFKVEIRPMAWDEIIPALLAKEIDMTCSDTMTSLDHKKTVDFSNVCWNTDQVVVVKSGSPTTMEDVLMGRAVIGARRDCAAARWIEDNLVKKNVMKQDRLRLYDNFSIAAKDLEAGRVDAAMTDDMILPGAIKGKPLKIVGTLKTGGGHAVAVRKEDAELKDTINEGLKRLTASLKWEGLKRKYDMRKQR